MTVGDTYHVHPDEEALVRAFVAPERRQRLLTLLATSKGRRKLIKSLAHFYGLDPRFAHPIVPAQQFAEKIYETLRAKGAPDRCHVMSENSELDGRTIDLKEALRQTVASSFGTFMSCIPGRLGYFEGEEPGERYILER